MDRDFLHELFAPFGAIDIKRMFGGMGLSVDSVTFGLVMGGAVYLKVDDDMIPRFEREGSIPFQVEMKGKMRAIPSYWRMPERLYDDPDEFASWAERALAAARRAAASKPAKRKRGPKKSPAAKKRKPKRKT